jgi:hypothetical protein
MNQNEAGAVIRLPTAHVAGGGALPRNESARPTVTGAPSLFTPEPVPLPVPDAEPPVKVPTPGTRIQHY